MKNSAIPKSAREISIGMLARRTGLAPSAIRYYEDFGLLVSERTSSGHRRYPRTEIRRLSLVRLLQRFDFSLSRIREALSALPDRRAPTEADWTRIADGLRDEIDERIEVLTRLRDDLDGCIGCGCLSLARCRLFNDGDKAAEKGDGPRYLMGDRPEEAR